MTKRAIIEYDSEENEIKPTEAEKAEKPAEENGDSEAQYKPGTMSRKARSPKKHSWGKPKSSSESSPAKRGRPATPSPGKKRSRK